MVFSVTTISADAASFTSKPKGVKAKCISGAAVRVSCKAKAGATGYNFYYNTRKGGQYTLGATSTSRSAVISGLTAGKKYYFKVQAYQGTDVKTYSKMSKAAKCKTVLKKPKISVTDKCGCKVCFRLGCQDGTKGFIVYRSTKKKRGYKKIKTVSGGPSVAWNDTSVKASTTYYYKIKAYSGKYKTKYSKVVAVKTAGGHKDGNHSDFNPANSGESQYIANYANRNIFFLGSSITYGSASGGVSFPDYLAARNNLKSFTCVNGSGTASSRKTPHPDSGIVWKEAVSGTTMARVGSGEKENKYTYSYRLHEYYDNTTINPDIFVCQLSLNDANKNIEIGEYKGIDFERLQGEDADADAYLDELYDGAYTVAGSIEYITAFAYKNWSDCQVVFYTITRFNGGSSANYVKMMSLLNDETANHINVVDLWNRAGGLAYPSLSGNNRCMFMADAHHPKKAGYQKWTPYFESALKDWMPEMPSYTVTWENEDGSLLDKDLDITRGSKPFYDGETPVKAEDANNTYVFDYWKDGKGNRLTSQTIVVGDVIYTAVFKAIPKENEQPENPGEVGGNGSDQNDPGQQPPGDGNGGSDEGSGNGSGGSDNDSDGGEQNTVPDITGMIQSLLRAA